MKKLILTIMFLSCVSLSSLTLANNNELAIKNKVDSYLKLYKEMLITIKDRPNIVHGFLRSGNYSDLNTQQLAAAIEILQLIEDGELDACCWAQGGIPTGLSNMPNISANQIINGTPGVPYFYRNVDDRITPFHLPTDFHEDYKALQSILNIMTTIGNTNSQHGTMKYYERQLMNHFSDIWPYLMWNFSYADAALYGDPDLHADFRNRYTFACVVCFGGGFYDTSKLHTVTGTAPNLTYTATNEYFRIFAKLSPATRNWMNNVQHQNQYPGSYTWNGPVGRPTIKGTPIQLSTGPTLQTSTASIRGNNYDFRHVYPTHCHGGTELYKTVSPANLITIYGSQHQIDRLRNEILPYNTHGSDLFNFSFVSKFGTAHFVKNMYPAWTNWINDGAFVWTGDVPPVNNNLGALFYIGEREYHSMHNGPWLQLTQWARLSSPAEGTYFPLHNNIRTDTRFPRSQSSSRPDTCYGN